jgi:hypothetical protein
MARKPSLHTDVSHETKAKFRAAALRYGCANEAQFMRVLIDHVLKNEPATGPVCGQSAGKRVQVKIGLTPEENASVVQLAQSHGAVRTTWIVNLIRAHITREPQFVAPEIDALMESNRQVAAIGRNLNQIARHLNLNPNACYPISVESIIALAQELREHRTSVARLLEANLNRWGLPK